MAPSKIILGLDPGTNLMGFGIIKSNNTSIKLIQYGVIKMNMEKEHHKRLKTIFKTVNDLIKEFKPHEISIEAPFYGKNVQSMLKLGRAQGAAIIAGEMNKINIFEYAPKKIKQSVTGMGMHQKSNYLKWLKTL